MAVRTRCPCCRRRFSAPDEYLGRKIDCPSCEHRFVLASPEDAGKLLSGETDAERRLEQDRERLALIERQDARSRAELDSSPYYERFHTGVGAVRHFDPRATSGWARLRTLAEWLIVLAYVALALCAAGGGLTIYLGYTGVIPSAALLFLCLVGWALVGGVFYCGAKLLGEAAFVLADMADRQRDAVQLLLDVRANTDPACEPTD